MKKTSTLIRLLSILSAILVFTACGGDSSNDSDSGSGSGSGSGSDSDGINEVLRTNNSKLYDTLQYWYFWSDSIKRKEESNLNKSFERYFNEELRYRVNTAVPYSQDTYGDRFTFLQSNMPLASSSANANYVAAGSRTPSDWGFDVIRWSGTGGTTLGYQVLYVIPTSPAYAGGLRRGDFISKVNNTAVTANNFTSLLGNNDITLSLISIVDGQLNEIGTKELHYASFTPTTIIHDTIYANSSPKTAYFFLSEFADDSSWDELKDMFKRFKEAGVENVVVDLRYNPGGAVVTSMLIASALTPDASHLGTTTMFMFQNKAGSNFRDKYPYFPASTSSSYPLGSGYSLGGIDKHVAPKRLAFIGTNSTASASELTYFSLLSLYGKQNCILVGSRTVGKNLAAMPLNLISGFIQPITDRIYNKENKSGYETGFEPDVAVEEFVGNPNLIRNNLGSHSETMLAKAIEALNGTASSNLRSTIATEKAPKGLKSYYTPSKVYPAVMLDEQFIKHRLSSREQ